MMVKRRTRPLPAAALIAGALNACGGGGSPAATPPAPPATTTPSQTGFSVGGGIGLPFLTSYGYKYKDAGIRLLSFSLSGQKELTRLETRSGELNPVDTGTAPINESLALKGMDLYHNSSCAVCDGGLLSNSGSNAPDLRESAAILDLDTMKAILHDGVLLPNGMPQFKDLSDEEILAISEYARQVIRDTKPRLRLANH